MPVNDTPFWVDVLGSIFAPRFLIAYWTYTNHLHPFVTFLFILAGICTVLSTRTGGTKIVYREQPSSKRYK